MTRLPYLKRDDLDEPSQGVWDSLTESRGAGLVNAEGGMIGPFNAFVTAPEVGTRLAELGGILRFSTSVERRLLELAIITIGARWKSEFEWWAHSRMAREFGVPDDVIAAIARGESPTFTDDADRAVHAVAVQLGADGRIDAETYAEAQAVLGDRGMVEIVSLCGYYTLICFTLNAFEVPLPPGAKTTFDA